MTKKNKKNKNNGAARNGLWRAKKKGGELQQKAPGRVTSFLLDHWAQSISLLLLIAGMGILSVIAGPSPGFVMWFPAPESYRSPVDFEYIDRRATRERREKAMYEAPLVFTDYRDQFDRSVERLEDLFETGEVDAVAESEEVRENLRSALAFLRERREELYEVLGEMREMVMVSPFDWGLHAPRDPKTVIVQREKDDDVSVGRKSVVTLSSGSSAFRELISPAVADLEEEEKISIADALAGALSPTARLDIRASERKADMAADMPPVVHDIQYGDILVRRGEVVGAEEMRRIRAAFREYVASERGAGFITQRLLGVLIVFVLFGCVFVLFYKKNRSFEEVGVLSPGQWFSLLFIVLALIGSASLCIAYGLSSYLIPLPALVMILSLIFGWKIAFVIAAFIPAIIALLSGSAGVEFPVFMVGGMVAALLTGRVRTRGHLIRCGLVIGLVQSAALPAFQLAGPEAADWSFLMFWRYSLFFNSFLAFSNGLLSGFLVTLLLPAIERIFHITTDIRLLEWSDPNQPLLQRMLLEAPGTYHHSMLVGSLAAEAAEAIGANPLLTRVSAYFHDVGKLKKPEYFAENMKSEAHNPHDELAPTMSKLIITAHPRDGAEMAARSGLPPAVQDIILQSHGTTRTAYFWQRARRQAADGDSQPSEDSFRYKLPKPMNKEAACVMLADAAESTTRSLQDPGGGKIAELVHQTILDRLHDGQLNDSGLSIPDLASLEKSLARGLSAVFHKRVKYPESEEIRAKQSQDGK